MPLSVCCTLVITALIGVFYLGLCKQLFMAMGIFTLLCLSVTAVMLLGFKLCCAM
ncbi:hypothetical protein [Psychrobacter pygoscelis]|uniref:hypothetical protein n=1 Tax=Psychrobacter pygoscelis TaxID=2488563 RepID=UPI0013F407B7|nr:hypothetical protein [Psychrobacter pygoscelis]